MTVILDKIMKERGISSKALCDLMESKGYKLSPVSISNILTGKHSPKVETLENIADALGVSVASLFDDFIPEQMKAIYEKNEDGTYKQIGYIRKESNE